MAAVVYVNCSSSPFIDDMMNRKKLFETRTKDTLHHVVNRSVLLAETGRRPSLVRCAARFGRPTMVSVPLLWDMFRPYTRVPEGSEYDWKPGTVSKWLYPVQYIAPVPVPFHPPEGVRHGLTWMEYEEEVNY